MEVDNVNEPAEASKEEKPAIPEQIDANTIWMGLMAIAKGKGKGKSKGKGKGNVRLCYSCGKPGHMAASCWSKSMGKGKAKVTQLLATPVANPDI